MKRFWFNQAPHSWGFLFVKMMMGRFGCDLLYNIIIMVFKLMIRGA